MNAAAKIAASITDNNAQILRLQGEIVARESAMAGINANLEELTEGTECWHAEHDHFMTLFMETLDLGKQIELRTEIRSTLLARAA